MRQLDDAAGGCGFRRVAVVVVAKGGSFNLNGGRESSTGVEPQVS